MIEHFMNFHTYHNVVLYFYKLLKGMARYAGQILVPAEGFGQPSPQMFILCKCWAYFIIFWEKFCQWIIRAG